MPQIDPYLYASWIAERNVSLLAVAIGMQEWDGHGFTLLNVLDGCQRRPAIPGTKPAKPKPVARPKAESKGALEIKTVLKAARALYKDIPPEDLAGTDEWIGVSRVSLAALWELIK